MFREKYSIKIARNICQPWTIWYKVCDGRKLNFLLGSWWLWKHQVWDPGGFYPETIKLWIQSKVGADNHERDAGHEWWGAEKAVSSRKMNKIAEVAWLKRCFQVLKDIQTDPAFAAVQRMASPTQEHNSQTEALSNELRFTSFNFENRLDLQSCW